jgi:hypothetical protein
VSTTPANTAVWDETMDARRAQFAGILTNRLVAALDDAQARGEITLALTSRDAAAMTIGPMYYPGTIERAPIDSALIEAARGLLQDRHLSVPNHVTQRGADHGIDPSWRPAWTQVVMG